MQSPLLRLPAELRNIIWKLAYSEERLDVHACRCPPHHHSGLHFKGSAPGLVCKQHWAEAVPIFLETCTFSFNDDTAFEEFLTTGSSVLAQVRRLAFYVNFIFSDTEERNAGHWRDTLMKVLHLSHELERLEGVYISAKCSTMYWIWGPLDLSQKRYIWELVDLHMP